MNAPAAPTPQGPTISNEQIVDAAAAGLELLDGEIAMSRQMRRRIAILEVILQQVASGNAVLANPQLPQVELPEVVDEIDMPPPEEPPTKKSPRRRAKPKPKK